MTRFPTAFISHSDHDHAFVRKLVNKLEEYGVPMWFDTLELRAGDSLGKKIKSSIKENDFLIVVLSEKSVDSSWVEYFMPLITTRHLLDFSYMCETTVSYRKGKGVNRLVDCIGLQLNDYDHFGLN